MPKVSPAQIQTVISRYIADYNFGVEMLAEKLDISISYLREIVNNCFHMNPQKLIESVKMEKAIVLLRESMPIDLVRIKTGYTNSRTFRRVFKKRLNMPPIIFKKKVCNNKKPVSLEPFIKQIWQLDHRQR